MIIKMQNLLIKIILILLLNSCIIQYFSLINQTNENPDLKTKLFKNKIGINLLRIEEKSKNNIYNSRLLEFAFANSKIFKFSKASNLNLTYATNSNFHQNASILFFFITLGLFPAYEDSISTVTFTFSNKIENTIFREYTYTIKGKTLASWLTFPFSYFLPFASKNFDGGMITNESKVSLNLLIESLESDILLEIEKNPELQQTLFSLGNPND
jgi:hypothetical protein